MGKPQFSIAVLLITVAVIGAVLALMVQDAQQWIASVCLLLLTFVGLAFSIVALMFGSDRIRPFGAGAAVPLICSSLWFTTQGALFQTIFQPEEYGMMVSLLFINRIVGSAILLAIAIGYLCLIFRWLISARGSNESHD